MVLLSNVMQVMRCDTTVDSSSGLPPEAAILGDLYDFFKKLIDYIKELKCGWEWSKQGDACLKDVDNTWKDEEDGKKRKCCSNLDAMYCMRDYALLNCDKDVYDSLDKKVKELSDELVEEEVCSKYGHRWYDFKSWKCRTPWTLIAVILATILFLVVLSFLIYYLFIKK